MNPTIPIGTLTMLALVLVMSLGMSLYLIQANIAGLQEVIWFFPLSCLLPMALMIVISWCVKVYRVITRTEQRD